MMRARFRVLIGVVAAAIAAMWLAATIWQVVWRSHHPAPLGRTAEAVDAALAAVLPAGTTRDSVLAFLDRAHVPASMDSVGERRVVALVPDIDGNLVITTDAQVEFMFDSTWRVRARRTSAVYTGP